MRSLSQLLALGAVAALASCAMPGVQTGQPREAVLKSWGAPTARHALEGGAERLEYATGPFGRTTWMIDLDALGRVRSAEQVLTEWHFADFMARAPGMSRGALLRELGSPGHRRAGGLRGGEVWSWRYPTNDCLWFQVTIDTATDKVRDAGYGIDWRCDAGGKERS